MSESLPMVGASSNTWGTQLNGFLGVEHNTDGTHKQNNGATTGVGLRLYTGGAVFSGNATTAATFQPLNLSSVVGNNTAFVLFEIVSTNSTYAVNVCFRPTGYTGTWAEMYTGVGAYPALNKIQLAAGVGNKGYCMCLTDLTGSVDWGQPTINATPGYYEIDIFVRAYIL